MIDQNAEAALVTDDFLNINLDALCSVISRDSLHVEEVELFKAVIRLLTYC